MAWLSRILTPVAFSPRCRGASQYAETLACHFHSELILLHVVQPPHSDAVALTKESLQQKKDALSSCLGGDCPGIPAVQEVVEGDPATEIAAYARIHHVDLIVMATHGYGPFRRFLLGSVTAKVLHDAGCPVWTGPHLEQAPRYDAIHFQHVVCAIDLSAASRRVLEWAARFACEFGAQLTMVHALPHVLIEIGDPALTVGDVASRRGADLVVIGRGSEPGLLGRLRTNAYAILRESPCPVATI